MAAPLLLDTCATIWITDDEPMSDQALGALDHAREAEEPIYVSLVPGIPRFSCGNKDVDGRELGLARVPHYQAPQVG
jgi:hypothetical protein